MSLKRRAKIQHSGSPQFSKQISKDMSINFIKQCQVESSNEQIILQKMSQKIRKILTAYQKLENENKKKDQIIKQLQKQNQLLKQRIVSRNDENEFSRMKKYQIQARKQPIQGHVIQRTFTPYSQTVNFKMPSKKQLEQNTYRPVQVYNTANSIVQQYSNTNEFQNKLLKESKSVQNLNKTISYRSKFEINSKLNNQSIKSYEQQSKIFSKRDQNRNTHEGLEQDKSFLDVLGKLKQKIKKFDQQDAQNLQSMTQNTKYQKNQFTLSKVKSTHNLTRKPFNQSQHRVKQDNAKQMKALKQIWNQRDQQIKRMDQLFKNIDQRLNITQK